MSTRERNTTTDGQTDSSTEHLPACHEPLGRAIETSDWTDEPADGGYAANAKQCDLCLPDGIPEDVDHVVRTTGTSVSTIHLPDEYSDQYDLDLSNDHDPDRTLPHSGPLKPTKPSEFKCLRCNARCTEGPDGTEYGHKLDCPDRPDDLGGSR